MTFKFKHPKKYKIKKEYIVIEPGLTSLKQNQIISEKKLKKSKIDFGWEKNYQTFTYKLYAWSNYNYRVGGINLLFN